MLLPALQIVDRRVDRDLLALGDGTDDVGAADDADDGAVLHYREAFDRVRVISGDFFDRAFRSRDRSCS